MISDIMFYIFTLFVIAALINLAIMIRYEKVLKAIEKNDDAINKTVMPIYITIQVIRRFAQDHPIAGFIHICSFNYMLFTAPVLFLLFVLEAIF